MDDRKITAVRRFNRAVTQRVGALDDAYLARGRSLGQSRLLWEIGGQGAGLKELRDRMGLDSGYLTRMVHALETAGLAAVEASDTDARARTVRLTAAGLVERAELDRLSDAQAESMLAPLDDGQRQRLVDAMGLVERLLLASEVQFEVVEPSHPDPRASVAAYFAELAARFDTGFEVGATLPLGDEALSMPAGMMLIARVRGDVLACGGVKLLADGVGEIKRVWVSPAARGIGLGKRMLAELESRAREHGCTIVRLDTNRSLTEAIALYRGTGYYEIEDYNAEPYAHHWFEKKL